MGYSYGEGMEGDDVASASGRQHVPVAVCTSLYEHRLVSVNAITVHALQSRNLKNIFFTSEISVSAL